MHQSAWTWEIAVSWIPALNLFLAYTFSQGRRDVNLLNSHWFGVCECDRVTDKGTMTSFCKIIKHIKLLPLAVYYIYILSSVLTWHQWGRTEMKHDWGQLNDWLSVMWVRSGTLLKIPKYRYPHMFSQIFHICIVLIAAVWHGSPELCTLGLTTKIYCNIEHLLIFILSYWSAVYFLTSC